VGGPGTELRAPLNPELAGPVVTVSFNTPMVQMAEMTRQKMTEMSQGEKNRFYIITFLRF